jgi:transposase
MSYLSPKSGMTYTAKGDFGMTKKRQYHNAEFKARVALDAIRGDKTISQLCSKYKVDASQITRWKKEAQEKMASIFNKKKDGELEEKNEEINTLYKQVGKLTIQNEFLREKLLP